jgi:hypothetical protein
MPLDYTETLDWRMTPGILSGHASTVLSVHSLFGYFLNDRKSPTPFPGRDALAHHGTYDWGIAPPLEKVIASKHELSALLAQPELYRQAIAVLEPWPNVGINLQGESVRASKNVAYVLQQIADADTILFPLWQSGISNPKRLANVLSGCIATIFEGGDPSAFDAASFDGNNANLEDLLALVDELLLRRSPGNGPAIFVCLGHQLAAVSHIRLIKQAVRDVTNATRIPNDPSNKLLNALQGVCKKISDVGESLQVIKHGEVIADGWHDVKFAVAPNEAIEVGTRKLLAYERRDNSSHVPEELHIAHALVADELEGVIDTVIAMDKELQIEMFHSDEVNEEAILFANWAYKQLHDTIVPIRYGLATSSLSWLLSLPYAVEVLSQTEVDDDTMTEVGTTCIYYKDWETHSIRRSFTCQFHPELMTDIRDIGQRPGPTYAELKQNDGVRLFVRLLYHGMQE